MLSSWYLCTAQHFQEQQDFLGSIWWILYKCICKQRDIPHYEWVVVLWYIVVDHDASFINSLITKISALTSTNQKLHSHTMYPFIRHQTYAELSIHFSCFADQWITVLFRQPCHVGELSQKCTSSQPHCIPSTTAWNLTKKIPLSTNRPNKSIPHQPIERKSNFKFLKFWPLAFPLNT